METFYTTESFHSHDAYRIQLSIGISIILRVMVLVLISFIFKQCPTLISSLEADDVTYPRVMFDRTPSSRVTARRGRAERSREKWPPELLLHPNRPLCLWIWERWMRHWQGNGVKAERSKHGGHRRWDRKEEKERKEHIESAFFFCLQVWNTKK